jgi:hypothetical protein
VIPVAILPIGKDGTRWQFTSIDSTVIIVENPGYDNETTHFRFDQGWSLDRVAKYIKELEESDILTQPQKYACLFWLGYFYRSFISYGPTQR